MEPLTTVANLLFVAGFLSKHLLAARLLSVAGTVLLAHHFSHLPEPVWTVFGWNLVFLGLNLWQLARLLRAQRAPAPRCRAAQPC